MKALSAFAIAIAVASSPAQAAWFTFNGTVAKIYSNDRTTAGGSASDHFTINGFTSAGSCITNDGRVAIYVADDEGGRRQWAMMLMARAMNLTLHIRVEDTLKTAAGGCKLMVIEVEH